MNGLFVLFHLGTARTVRQSCVKKEFLMGDLRYILYTWSQHRLEPLFLYKDASLRVLGRELRPKLNATFVDLLDISSGLGWTADQL